MLHGCQNKNIGDHIKSVVRKMSRRENSQFIVYTSRATLLYM